MIGQYGAILATPAVVFVLVHVLRVLKDRVEMANGAVRWAAARADVGTGAIPIWGDNGRFRWSPTARENFTRRATGLGWGWLARLPEKQGDAEPVSVVALAARVDGVPLAALETEYASGARIGVLAALGASGVVLEAIDRRQEPFPPPALARRFEALAGRARAGRTGHVIAPVDGGPGLASAGSWPAGSMVPPGFPSGGNPEGDQGLGRPRISLWGKSGGGPT